MSGNVALVTGASSGIGRATAIALVERGWSVLLTARRQQALMEVASACMSIGDASTEIVPADISDGSSVAKVGDALRSFARGAKLVAVVNSAGIAANGPFETTDIELSCQEVEINLIGMMRMTHAALPTLRAVGAGHIVNVLSIAATVAFGGMVGYCASKAGGLAFGRCLAHEVRKEGIRVTNVLPGATDTPIWEGAAWVPERADMLPAKAIAEIIVEALESPSDRSIDEIVVMPPKGVL